MTVENDPRLVPFADEWSVVDGSSDGGVYTFEVSDGTRSVVVELSLVDTLTTPATAAVAFWLPGEDEPYRERHIVIGDSRQLSSVVTAWKRVAGSAVGDVPLLQILRYLADQVLVEAEQPGEAIDVSTAEVDDGTRRVMFEPSMVDEQLTTWFGQAGAGKSKLLTAFAVDVSNPNEESFLGLRYASRRPFLFLDFEEVGDAGRDVFLTQVEAVCEGHGVDRSEVGVYYLQPRATFARSLPQMIVERDRIAKICGAVPITGIDSITKATGGNPKSTEAWSEFEAAFRQYGTTTIGVDHEVKSASGGLIQGASPKTAAYRHSVYVEKRDGLVVVSSKKSNRLAERAIATYHVEVRRDDEERVTKVIYREGLTARRASRVDVDPGPSNREMLLMWARLTGLPVTTRSLEGDHPFATFKKNGGGTIRNLLPTLTKLKHGQVFAKTGRSSPVQYRLTEKGRGVADKLLAENPETVERFNEAKGGVE